MSMVPRAARTVNCLGFWGLGALGISAGEGCKHTLVQEAQLRTWLALSNRAGLSRLPVAVLKVCGGVLSAYLGPPPPFVSIQRCQIDTPLQSQICVLGTAQHSTAQHRTPAREEISLCQAIFLLQVKPAATAKAPSLTRSHMGDCYRL